MVDIMIREASTCDLRQLFQKFIPETIGKLMENECQGIYPLKDCYIRKAKILRRPKFDPFKLAELHSHSSNTEDQGTPVVQETKPSDVVAPERTVVGAEVPVQVEEPVEDTKKNKDTKASKPTKGPKSTKGKGK